MQKFMLALTLCLPACAQVPNTVLIGPEGITVTAISSPTAVLYFGAGNTWNKITALKFPLGNNCSSPCHQLLGDPAQGVPKSLYAQQQAEAFTVTYSVNGATTVKTIPALNAQTAVRCSTSGNVVFSQPAQVISYKQVMIYANACNGTASYTYPTAFSHTPRVLSQSNAGLATSVSTSAVTITGTTSTGFLELDGY